MLKLFELAFLHIRNVSSLALHIEEILLTAEKRWSDLDKQSESSTFKRQSTGCSKKTRHILRLNLKNTTRAFWQQSFAFYHESQRFSNSW